MAKLLYFFLSNFEEKHTVPSHKHMCYELVYYTHAKGKSYYQKASSPAKTDIDFTENAAIDRSNLLTFSDNSFIIFPPNVLHDERTERAASVFSVGFYADTETEKDLARFALKVFTDTDFFIWKYIKSLKIEFSEKSTAISRCLTVLSPRCSFRCSAGTMKSLTALE